MQLAVGDEIDALRQRRRMSARMAPKGRRLPNARGREQIADLTRRQRARSDSFGSVRKAKRQSNATKPTSKTAIPRLEITGASHEH